jgi:hypothetical protein
MFPSMSLGSSPHVCRMHDCPGQLRSSSEELFPKLRGRRKVFGIKRLNAQLKLKLMIVKSGPLAGASAITHTRRLCFAADSLASD